MDRERVERMLREPNNMFGPPTGRGYDHLRAAMTVAALALGALSGWCLLDLHDDPAVHPALRTVFLALSLPFAAGVLAGWPLWPLTFVAAWPVAAAVWYATLYTAAAAAGLRRGGRVTRVCAALAAAAGWVTGLAFLLSART
jgi:hypothetical protein